MMWTLSEYQEAHPRASGEPHARYESETRHAWALQELTRIQEQVAIALPGDDPFVLVGELAAIMETWIRG